MQNHLKKDAVWLVIRKKDSESPNLSWSEAVDQALCFGWVDSVKVSVDSVKYKQYFSKRKPRSMWSKINKDKVARLTREGLMTAAGKKSVALAKKNGSWTQMDAPQNLEIPQELEAEFVKYPDSRAFYEGLSASLRKSCLHWIAMAMRPETRKKRINSIIASIRGSEKPKPF